jgi:hypothetical protein
MESSTGIAFLEFTDKDRQRLLEAYLHIRPKIPEILDVFYDALKAINFDPQDYGANIDNLKEKQIEHWRRLFKGRFDTEYENTARRIAIKHYEIGLPHDLYVLSCMKLLTKFNEVIAEVHGIDGAFAREMSRSVEKAIAIDMVHALTPYTGDLV